MVNISRLVMVAILSVALVAICSVADAKPAPITVTVDTIQINGHYFGTPTLLNNVPGYYGYEYNLFVPDGTFTVSGTVKNLDKNNTTSVWIGVAAESQQKLELFALDIDKPNAYAQTTLAVPASGESSFVLSLPAESVDDIIVYWNIVGSKGYYNVDTSDVEVVYESDSTQHTVDMGPMSDAVAIYSNGKLTYNGLPQYWAYI